MNAGSDKGSDKGSGDGGGKAVRKTTIFQLAGAVFWAFFGVRKSSAYEADVKNLNPLHVVIAGIIGALIFIAALILIVQWVIGSGVAAAT
jgi:amino acid transporter